ncbi:MAG: hypothetical protein WAX77_09645 [Methylococcaceae bacterium]
MCLDVVRKKNPPPKGMPFCSLGGTQQDTVFIEFLTALARFCGRYSPTILVLDDFKLSLFEGWFEYFRHHFLDPENQFQTIITTARYCDFDLHEVHGNGWQVIHISGQENERAIKQFIDNAE